MSPPIIDEKEIENARRKIVNITLSEPVFNMLESFRQDLFLVDENGEKKEYPRSYLIEDLIFFVIGDEDRFNQFVEETYNIVEKEEEEEYGD